MKLILTIAWRNIMRHKGKSLVIGGILFLGALLMTVGNGVISGMDHGIEHNIIDGFLGDLVVVSDQQKSDSILFDMMGSMIEPILNYPQIKPVLASQPAVSRWLPVGKNMAMALSEDPNAMPGYIYLLGVDFAEYLKMFPHTLTTVEGRLPEPGERGILVPTFSREEFYNFTNTWLLPEGGQLIEANLNADARESLPVLPTADNVVLMGMNEDNTSTDLRFKVKGIVRYRSLNTIFGHFNLTDIESYRECLGYFSAGARAVEVPKEDQQLLNLDAESLDALFGSEALVVERYQRPRPVSAALTRTPALASIEAGAYNLIMVRLKPKAPVDQVQRELNAALAKAKLGARVISWKKASGVIGSLSTLIKGALLVFVSLIFVVAIIIIINTLSMSAMERVPEIGMMRAVGARRGFIRSMFLGEIATLAGVFGGAGLLIGILAVNVIPLLNLTTTNDFVQLLYGGDVFRPLLKVWDIAVTLLELAFVTLLASIYPLKLAGNITPLDAIARD
jgi:ABC-type lipoprotein release transport system permease subunit